MRCNYNCRQGHNCTCDNTDFHADYQKPNSWDQIEDAAMSFMGAVCIVGALLCLAAAFYYGWLR